MSEDTSVTESRTSSSIPVHRLHADGHCRVTGGRSSDHCGPSSSHFTGTMKSIRPGRLDPSGAERIACVRHVWTFSRLLLRTSLRTPTVRVRPASRNSAVRSPARSCGRARSPPLHGNRKPTVASGVFIEARTHPTRARALSGWRFVHPVVRARRCGPSPRA